MKFTTAIFAVTLLANSAFAIPAAEAEPGLVRAGKLTKWCVAPGQMCYKSKRDLEHARDFIAAGFEAPEPEDIEKRGLVRAGKLTKWCVAPGQMCYKSKRDFDDAAALLTAGFEAPHPDEIEKRGLVRAGKLTKWCVAPGQMCYKSKRDFDEAAALLTAGFEAPHPDEIEKREPKKKSGLVRAGKLTKWCVAPGQMCYKNKRDFNTAVDEITSGEHPTYAGEYDSE